MGVQIVRKLDVGRNLSSLIFVAVEGREGVVGIGERELLEYFLVLRALDDLTVAEVNDEFELLGRIG